MTPSKIAVADELASGGPFRAVLPCVPGLDSPPNREAGHLLGAVIAGSPDAVIVVDESGRIILSNPAVQALFGYYPEELVGEQIETLIPQELHAFHREHRERFAKAPQARQMGSGLELTGRARDGTGVPIDVSLAPVEVLGRTLVAAFVRDATERQRTTGRLRAVNEVTSLVLAGGPVEKTLAVVAQHAVELVGAAAGWIVTPGPTACLVSTTVGAAAGPLLGLEINDTPRRPAGGTTDTRSSTMDLSAAEVPKEIARLGFGPAICTPLVSERAFVGTLVVAREAKDDPFDDLDLALVEVFAGAATIALQLGRARDELEAVRILDDEERIALDLHDNVIQQLFALGLSLQATSQMTDGHVGERLGDAVDLLDGVIREIRNTIFGVTARSPRRRGLDHTLESLFDEMAVSLGFKPGLRLVGARDNDVPDEVLGHVVAVLRESLSHISRHARATRADVVVGVELDVVRISIVDDGVGPPEGVSAGHGLVKLAERARRLGGTFAAAPRSPNGMVLEWSVPVTPSSAPRRHRLGVPRTES